MNQRCSMKSYRQLPFLLAALLLLAVVCAAQEPAKIYGKVRDASGAIVVGIQVRATSDCSCSQCSDPQKCKCCPEQQTVTTDQAGEFFVRVKPGTYYVRVQDKEISVTVHAGEDKNVGQIKVE